jgi:ribonuclease E
VGEIFVDDADAFQKAQEYMQRFMPAEAQRRLKHYQEDVPLFTRFQIESQIESAYAHKVQLPSGGSLVIDYTEALVSIDINSARSTRGGDIETTATNTNLEAAEEIARQLRIRDIGGLIVIDFIDMESTKNQRDVEDRLRDAMKMDRARIQIGRLSRFGLMEMSRQRLRPSLGESSHMTCPRCTGIGSIRSVESMALSILRLAGEEARKERTARLVLQVPVSVATYLMNEKRATVRSIEETCSTELVLVPNPNIETPEFSIRRVREDETALSENSQVSYKMPTAAEPPDVTALQPKRPPTPVAAVAPILPTTLAPSPPEAPPVSVAAAPAVSRAGLWGALKRIFVGDEPAMEKVATEPARGERPRRDEAGRGRGRDRSRDGHRDGERSARGGRGAQGGERPDRGGGRDRNRDRDRGRSDRDQPRGDAQRSRRAQGGSDSHAPRSDAPPRHDAPPPRNDAPPRNEPAAVTAAPEGAVQQGSPRPDGEKRSRRGGRRRRRGGGGGGAQRPEGAMAANDFSGNSAEGTENFSLQHSAGPGDASEPFPMAAAPTPRQEPDYAPPPEAPRDTRPAVVWSSAAVPSGPAAAPGERDE